jgi:hypothetical protein
MSMISSFFSRNIDEHIEILAEVLHRLVSHNLKVKPEKCQFFREEILFLGFRVNKEGIGTDLSKTQAVIEWRRPENRKQLKSFLGTCSYYRSFISEFRIIAEALYALTRKGVRFQWSDKAENAFCLLKQKLTTAPVLALPRDNTPLILDTDASDTGLGVVLSVSVDGQERPVAYASRTYTLAESRYCITRRELLGLIFGLKKFRQYLVGRQFTLRTDHAPLMSLQTNPNPSSQMLRWIDFLQEFTFRIVHRPGTRHQNADGLSRSQPLCRQCNITEEHYVSVDNDSEVPATQLRVMACRVASRQAHDEVAHLTDDIASQQARDHDIGPVYAAMLASTQEPDWNDFTACNETTKAYLAQWSLLLMKNNILYRRWIDGYRNTKWLQCLIPRKLVPTVIQQAHTGITGGHLAVRMTLQQVNRRSYWKTWRADTTRFCRQCQQCNTYRRGTAPKQGEMQQMTTGAPMERIGIDLSGPFPVAQGKRFILSAICHWTRWAEAIPLPNKEAPTVAKALVENVYCRLGVPLQQLSDQGKKIRQCTHDPDNTGTSNRRNSDVRLHRF